MQDTLLELIWQNDFFVFVFFFLFFIFFFYLAYSACLTALCQAISWTGFIATQHHGCCLHQWFFEWSFWFLEASGFGGWAQASTFIQMQTLLAFLLGIFD